MPPLIEGHISIINDFLEKSIEQGRYSGLVVVGDYGFGKTHLLRWLEHRIEQDGEGFLEAIFIQNPGNNIRDLIFSMTRSIGGATLKRKIWFIVLRLFRIKLHEQGEKFLTKFRPAESLRRFTDEKPELDRFTEEVLANNRSFLQVFRDLGYDMNALSQFALETIADILESKEIAEAFVAFAIVEDSDSLRAWSRLTSETARGQLSVPPQDYFKALLTIMRESGTMHVFLLLDEFEELMSVRMTQRKRIEYAASLRVLIDTHLREFSLVVATTSYEYDELKEIYPPTKDRLNFIVRLRPLKDRETRLLITRYLDMARVPEFEGFLGKLTPFTEETVGLLAKKTGGNPRAIVSRCHELVEYCRRERIGELTLEHVDRLVGPSEGASSEDALL